MIDKRLQPVEWSEFMYAGNGAGATCPEVWTDPPSYEASRHGAPGGIGDGARSQVSQIHPQRFCLPVSDERVMPRIGPMPVCSAVALERADVADLYAPAR